jgi:hypothetical protein
MDPKGATLVFGICEQYGGTSDHLAIVAVKSRLTILRPHHNSFTR